MQFGGDLDFISTVNKGSTFIFNLDFELDEGDLDFAIPGGLANHGQLEPFPSGRFRAPREKEAGYPKAHLDCGRGQGNHAGDREGGLREHGFFDQGRYRRGPPNCSRV